MYRDRCARQHRRHGSGQRRRANGGPPDRARRQRARGDSHLWTLRKFLEVGFPFLDIRVAPLLRLLTEVVKERGVTGELLDAREPIIGGVEARLQQAQGERAELEHAPAPRDRFLFELVERHDLVDQTHVERLLRVVLLAQEPDLARFLLPDDAREQARAVAAVEASDARPGLTEA